MTNSYIAPLRFLAWLALLLAPAIPAHAQVTPISEAETALFMSDHLSRVPPATTLRYTMVKSGSLEKGFTDTVEIDIGGSAKAKQAVIRCLSQKGNRLDVPPVDSALGNPAILCFLERDIREMKRLTGAKNHVYFQKRIRLALAEAAEVKPVTVNYNGRQLSGREITIHPYEDDPNKARFEKFIGKTYVFVLADDIPGVLFRAEAVIPDRSKEGAPPLIREELAFTRASDAGAGR